MTEIIKKVVAVSMTIVMALYGLLGLSSGISNDYTEGKYKNVILMIGDGMGFNTLEATKHQKNVDLTMETMPIKAESQTWSFGIPATDSAAGGTALSCGIRVWINSVGLYPFDPFTPDDLNVPKNLSELALENGKAAGVVTTDSTTGATPSSFSAHALDRGMADNLFEDQMKSGLNLIWGAETSGYNDESFTESGYTLVSSIEEFEALSIDDKSYAQFSFDALKTCDYEKAPSIEAMTEKAIETLNEDEDGFFLMVEGACIDKYSHSNDFEGSTKCTVEFDKAVKAALDFAKEDGETLVIVTADHETGGIKYNSEKDEYYYTSGDHTNVNVPVFVSAADAGIKTGDKVKNRQIAVQIARIMGFDSSEFPASK